ncbi:MAG TPA: hypothetical protein VGE73_00785 [Pseudolabrys sp.]
MQTFGKIFATVAVVGAVAVAAASPSEARNGRWAAAGVGFAAGAVVGAAAANAANSNYYYGSGYYGQSYGPSYGYAEPSYGYVEPSYGYDAYAYEPGPTYVAPTYRYRRTDSKYGNGGYNNMGIGSQR